MFSATDPTCHDFSRRKVEELVFPQAGIKLMNVSIEVGVRRSAGLLITVNVKVALQL